MKTVIITGAHGHLGTVVTQYFLEKGYKVIATVSHANAVSEMPRHEHLQIEVVNLAFPEASEAFVQQCISTHTSIDAALLLAGGFAAGTLQATRITDIQQQITLNFETAYHVARPLFQHLLQQNKGRLVFVGARPALQPADAQKMVAYSLSKSLLFRLAEILNAEAKGKNVSATVIVPSTIDTAANRKSMPQAKTDNWVKPQTIAEILDFICSDTASVLKETILKVYNNA